MDKQEFGHLVAALRKQQLDPETGRGWTQRALAERANLSEKIIGNIEQGRKASVEVETLVRLANALGLNPWERRRFFSLAQGISWEDVMPETVDPADSLTQMLNTLRALRLPAILYDPFYHVVAVNELGLALHNISGAQRRIQPQQVSLQLLRFLLANDSPMRQNMRDIWTNFLHLHVLQFRNLSLRYRHTDYFGELFAALSQSGEFRQAWLAAQSYSPADLHALTHYRYRHPQHGPLAYATTLQPTRTAAGFLYLSTLTPLDVATANIFQALVQPTEADVLRITPWPQRELRSPPPATRHFVAVCCVE
jgi:transcriptional regulator with XRE-family HTH domain